MSNKQKVLNSFDNFYRMLSVVFPKLPIDLRQTLDDVREFIVKSK